MTKSQNYDRYTKIENKLKSPKKLQKVEIMTKSPNYIKKM